MDQLRQDLRYAFRTLLARPGFTAVVVVTLGLGIGTNSAIFTLVNAIMFKPLPVYAPEELVNIYVSSTDGSRYSALSYPDLGELVERDDLFTEVVGYGGLMGNLTGGDRGEVVFGEYVTANYFSGLGVTPQLGRGFVADEGLVGGSEPVIVISSRVWRRWFYGSPDVIGQEVKINGVTLTIVGVAPDDFHGVLVRGLSLDVWVPVAHRADVTGSFDLDRRDNRWVTVKARLQPNVSVDRVRAALATLSRNLEEAYPETHTDRQFVVLPMTDVYVHPEADKAIATGSMFLMGAVGLVLLIACANVANLMLARALGRRREIAVRLALGASRRRLVQQLLIESVVLAGAGGIVGLTLAYWLAALVLAFNPPFPIAISLDFALDLRVVLFTGGVAMLTGVFFGLIPALQATNPALMPALKDQELKGGSRKLRFRNALLLPQVALSLFLLIVAGLFGRSVQNASSVELGFDEERTGLVTVELGQQPDYDTKRAELFWEELVQRARSLPGVRTAAISSWIPLGTLFSEQYTSVHTEDETGRRALERVTLGRIGTDYFEAFGIAVRGRTFTESDIGNAASVAIVSEATVRRLWPDGNVIGKRLRTRGENGPEYEVVGVAANAKVRSLGEDPQPFVYLPIESYTGMLHLVMSASQDPAAVVAALRDQVRQLDDHVAVFQSVTMSEYLSLMLFPFRLAAAISAALGLLALTLAGVGLYGVVSYGVARRTHEMGVRMALGANARDVVRLVVGEGMRVVILGMAVGIALAFGATRLLSSVLFGISASDPFTFTMTPAVLAAVALAAHFFPARRATRVDPVRALRSE